MLLVEDNFLSASMLSVVLEDHGYRVQTVAAVRDALDAIAASEASEGFSHVIVDLMLPDGEGEQVVRALRERGSEASIIVLTGVSDPNRLRNVVNLGPRVMLKPVGGKQLLAVMEQGD